MKFKTRIKLMVSILVTTIVLMNSLMLVLYIADSLKKNAVRSTESVSKQTLLTFNGVLERVESISRLPLIDGEIFEILNKNYDEYDSDIRTYEKYRDMDRVVSKIGNEMMDKNNIVYGVTIFPQNTDLVYSKNRYAKRPHTEKLETKEWYKKVNQTDGTEILLFPKGEDEIYKKEEEVISLARLLYNPMKEKKLGVIRIDIAVRDLENIWDRKNLMEGSEVVVLNSEDKPLFTSIQGIDENTSWETIKKEIQQSQSKEMEIVGEKKSAILTESDVYGVSMITFVSPEVIYKDAYATIKVIILFAVFCLLIAFIMTEVISRQIMRPISELKGLMKKVRNGDLTVRSKISVEGDFEEVCQSFDLMVEKMEELVEKIYKEEQEKQLMEYKALQAQISPHFTLNTINTIQWMARIQGNTAIEGALDSLANILSFAVRENKEKISIGTELKQMGYYLNILSLRYYNKFNVSMEIEEETKNCITIKYLLQTIVENSVFHGFDNMEERGEIRVSIYKKGDNIIYEVEDNGKGIPENKIPTILDEIKENKNGRNKIGLSNIHRRIQLVFGEQYGIKIESKEKEYTRVIVVIPMEEENDNEADINRG